VTLRLWGGNTDSGCCSVGDVEDARRVAAQLDVPHYVFNLAEHFNERVVAPYVEGYAAGRTPNPCVECNRSIKFGVLLGRAAALGFDAVATGHHARVQSDLDGGFRLLRGLDMAKDQSYVLYMLGQSELAQVMLPVGELTKAEVRAHAARLGLRTAAKPESMDVCFVARDERHQFLDERAPGRPGHVVDVHGELLAEHDGVSHFTIGQRRGLGVAAGERRYVVDVNAASATVTIGRRDDLLRSEIPVRDVTWVRSPVDGEREVEVQMRAHGQPVRGRVVAPDRVVLHTAQPRVAPGQVVAFYDDEVLVGGGIAA
jgi:tRNA-specific 2-thiouridylase